jgi:large subunit ribosomal protein L21
MYAIIQTGGKQYKVAQGDTIRIEKLDGAVGDTVKFQDVLFTANGDKVSVGKPTINGAIVVGKIVAQGKNKKIIDVTFRRKKHSSKTKGHRQKYTGVQITGIEGA